MPLAVDVTQTLRSALNRLESEKERLDRQITAIRMALGGTTGVRGPARRRRAMSAAARRAVSLRMKAYWAARRKGKAARANAKVAGAPKTAKSKKAEKAS